MTKYEKGTIGYYLEKAKEEGFDNTSDYFKWKNRRISKDQLVNKRIKREYHLWRWRIKRTLIEEKIIENVLDWKSVLDIFDSLIVDILENNISNEFELKERLLERRSQLIEHHTKYLEIHGVDETVWITEDVHRDIHNRLRKEGKCNIPPKELENISLVATRRTERHGKKVRECTEKYRETDRYRRLTYDRMKKLRNNWFIFKDKLVPNVYICEEIVYYDKTKALTVSSFFQWDKRRVDLPVIEID